MAFNNRRLWTLSSLATLLVLGAIYNSKDSIIRWTTLVIRGKPWTKNIPEWGGWETSDNHQQQRRDLSEFMDAPTRKWLEIPRKTDCPSTNPNIRSPNELLDEAFLRKAYIAEYLAANMVYDPLLYQRMDKYKEIYEHFHAWTDLFDDVSLMVKIENVCYGSFRGTNPFNFNDLVLQNLKPNPIRIAGTNCFVRGGYYDGYYTNFRAEFEQKSK